MDPFASINAGMEDGELIIFGDIESGSSGSLLISRETHHALGILWGRVLLQKGISSTFLLDKLKEFIADSNIQVTAQDNIVLHNIAATPVDNAEIKIILGYQEQLIPFDTLQVENHDDYYITRILSYTTIPLRYHLILKKQIVCR